MASSMAGLVHVKEDEEEGAGADGEPRKPRQEEEDALHDTSIWGWQGLDARHFTDGFLGRWGMLMLRTLETILFLFTMIFQASAPPNVATTDYNGLRPHWLTYLTNWTFLLFGAQAALGLAIVIVDLCRTLPCCSDTPLLSPSYDDVNKAPRSHQQRLPFPPPPQPAPVPLTTKDAAGTKPQPMQAVGDGSRSTSPAHPVQATGNGSCSTPLAHPTMQEASRVNADIPVRHAMVPRPPTTPDPPAPSAPPALYPNTMPPSPSFPSRMPLASHAGYFSVPSAAPMCTHSTAHMHHAPTTHAPYMYQTGRSSNMCSHATIEAAVRLTVPPPPGAPHPPHPPAPPVIPEDAVEPHGTSQPVKESAGEVANGDHWHLHIIPWHIKGPGWRRWWEPFTPQTDDLLPPRLLNFFEKTYLLLYQTTFVASIIVTIFYWGALSGSGVKASSVLKHGGHAFAMLLDLILSRMPAVAFHIVVVFWYGTIYSIFMFIYQIEMWRYKLVGWDDRLSPAAYVVLYVIMVVLFIIMFAIVLLRDWLILAFRRYLGPPAR
eukprot:CAMPEP_0202368754 /NCGR_PEP_ID=MMETSP1127-20130417/706_1 /ASSEMBLY_ACC=CAM_ASM_000462 /TAXON_ID=3047 /ORGANISM="Dunaliella tertiolecta, Strain CCMP1320" /LENGTH=544 /DNA_ID=CAMNT_0048964195 /DNA_START=257 /DNA_END=1892 /DNA_ORIENTATION=-